MLSTSIFLDAEATTNNRKKKTNLFRYNEMFPLIQEWRSIGRKYSDLGVYAYSERSTYADQVVDCLFMA